MRVKENRTRTPTQPLQAKVMSKTTEKRKRALPRQVLRPRPCDPGTRLGAAKHLAITIDDSDDNIDDGKEAPVGLYEIRRCEDEATNAKKISLTSADGLIFLHVACRPRAHPATASCPLHRHLQYTFRCIMLSRVHHPNTTPNII
jgi:hypothetical protein